MADALISVVVEQLAPFLLDKLKKEVKLVLGAPEDVQELHDTFDKIRDVLDDAEKRHVKNVIHNFEKNESKKVPESAWLEKLKDVSYEMEDVLDEWHTKILKSEIAADESSALDGVDGARTGKKKVCKTRHLSVMASAEDEGRIPLLVWNLKSLRTLLVRSSLSFQDLTLLSHLTSLRTLHLWWYTDMKELPKEIEKLIHLRYLQLSETDVEELPEVVTNLSNLQTFRLDSCWKLRRLPNGIGKLVNLRHLEVRGPRLLELPETISNLSNLQTLKLNGCRKLRRLPDEIGSLVSLRQLEAGYSGLKELPEVVTNLSNLQTLILNRCYKLRRLPNDMGKMVNLRQLEVKDTKLEEVPETVGNLSNLQTLKLNGCRKLRRLPNGIGKLVSLRHLDVGSTALKELPESISNLSNLQTLKLMYCSKLRRLPNDMGKMVSLRHLEFDLYSFDCLPPGIGKLRELETLTEFIVSEEGSNIRELKDLNNLRGELAISNIEGVELLEAILKDKEHLRRLVLRFNDDDEEEEDDDDDDDDVLPRLEFLECLELEELDSVSSIMGLQVLNGGSGDISEPVIAFPNLKKLDISYMKHWEEWVITTTTDITVMPLLQKLTISHCPLLKSLPCQILSNSLREMLISNCPHLKVSCLPPFLENLLLGFDAGSLSISLPIQNGLHSKLKFLYIWCSPHSTLPQGLSQLKSLKFLIVSDCNSLTCIPEELQYLTSLEELCITECPILGPRCQKEVGEDWSIICHIPNIYNDGEKIQ
ncbi:hypothetical protein GIB67_025953 [Kingdonia uniflora]|uniref:Uncharacterized protein n=1 Tax=Kingdonia uniflora TaxID=39325 RepID=A0A7J7L834_9MAGN|nr:hypothetical protein GIB67_025953 [Kingdonia uniflora]